MKVGNIVGAVGAITVGIGCIVVDTWSNIEFIGGTVVTSPADLLKLESWNSLMAAVVVVAVATAVSLAAAGASWRRGSVALAGGLLLAFGCGAAFSLSATLDRVGSARDAAVEGRQSHNVAIEHSDAALQSARRALGEAEKASKLECEGAPADLTAWPKCRSRKADAATVLADVARLEAALAELGAKRETDSMGSRVAALLPWMTARQVQTYQPMLLPVALFLFGNLLVAFGIASFAAPAMTRAQPQIDPMTNDRPMIDVTPQPSAPAALTRAEQVAAFVGEFIADNGREPSFSEVRDGTGLPASTVSKYRQKALAGPA